MPKGDRGFIPDCNEERIEELKKEFEQWTDKKADIPGMAENNFLTTFLEAVFELIQEANVKITKLHEEDK